MRTILIAVVALALLLTGCTDAQIQRAEAASAAVDLRLAQAEHAEQVAQDTLAAAEQLAEASNSDKALAAVAAAQAAVEVASSTTALAKSAAGDARTAVQAAKDAQAAGGSTLDVLIAVVTTLFPAAGVTLTALRRMWASSASLRQVVAGVEKAKAAMPSDQVDKLHQALAITTDDRTKLQVATIKAAA